MTTFGITGDRCDLLYFTDWFDAVTQAQELCKADSKARSVYIVQEPTPRDGGKSDIVFAVDATGKAHWVNPRSMR